MGSVLHTRIRDTFNRKMLRILCLTIGLATAMAAPNPELLEEDTASLMENEARFLYFNSSSTATSLTLLGVIFYLVYVSGLLSTGSSSQYAYNRYGQDYGQYQGQGQGQYQARSSTDGFNFNAGQILTWISMASDAYNTLDYKDLECQKKLICEVIREEDAFGNVSRNMKNGMQLAKFLEVLNLPDEMRELLDEYEDANEVAVGNKECGEVFECNYSLKDSVNKSFYGNSL